MSRIMLDGIGSDAEAIAQTAISGREFRNMHVTMAAGYVDGPVSEWSRGQWAVCAAAGLQRVQITVTGVTGAHVADVETGDLDPESGATWAAGQHRIGQFGVLYVNRANKGDVIAECSKVGLHLGEHYGLGVATLDGGFTDSNGSDLRHDPGVVFVQYLPATRAGGPFDVSVVTDDAWLPAAPAPAWTEQAAADLEHALVQANRALAALKAHPHG